MWIPSLRLRIMPGAWCLISRRTIRRPIFSLVGLSSWIRVMRCRIIIGRAVSKIWAGMRRPWPISGRVWSWTPATHSLMRISPWCIVVSKNMKRLLSTSLNKLNLQANLQKATPSEPIVMSELACTVRPSPTTPRLSSLIQRTSNTYTIEASAISE